jgi:glycosyltransferase involved in cell wall biosynthesis
MTASALPEISFVVPVSGCEDLLPLAIASAVKEAPYRAEIIVVDDGPDYLPEPLVQSLQDAFPETRFMRQAHAGVGAARNRGLAETRGEFVCFLDADDLVDASSLQELLTIARKHTSDITSGTIQSFQGERRWTNYVWRGLTKLHATNTSCVRHPVSVRHNHAGGKLYRREFLRSQDLWFPTDVQRGEDWLFSLSAMSRSSKLTFIPRTSYYYRFHGDERISLSSTISLQVFQDLSVVYRRLNEVLVATETSSMRRYRDSHFLHSIRYHLIRFLRSDKAAEQGEEALSSAKAFFEMLSPSVIQALNPYDRLAIELIRAGALREGSAFLMRGNTLPLKQLKTIPEVLQDQRALSEVKRFQLRWSWSLPLMSLRSRLRPRK